MGKKIQKLNLLIVESYNMPRAGTSLVNLARFLKQCGGRLLNSPMVDDDCQMCEVRIRTDSWRYNY